MIMTSVTKNNMKTWAVGVAEFFFEKIKITA